MTKLYCQVQIINHNSSTLAYNLRRIYRSSELSSSTYTVIFVQGATNNSSSVLNGRSTDASSGWTWTGGGLSATTIIYPFINSSNYSTPPDWRIQYRTQEFIKCNQQSNLKMFKIMLNKSRPRPSDIKTSLGRSLPLPV